MSNIAVCICTFRNPDGLRALLEGIDKQVLRTILDEDVIVVVVDNDSSKSAGTVLQDYQRDGRFQLFSINQPKRGLSCARNCVLDATCVRSSEFFAFIDDDEVPSTQWLQALADSLIDPACSIVVGPVEPVFEEQPPAWIISGGFFSKRCGVEDEFHEGYTSNVMIRTSIVAKSGIRFDESLNLVGGEDVLFFRELQLRGFSVHCSPRALVHETILARRATLAWMLRRWFRAGATSARLNNCSTTVLRGFLASVCGGLFRMIGGSGAAAAAALTHGRKDFAAVARSLSTVFRGAGMFMSAFGYAYKEYGSSYRRTST